MTRQQIVMRCVSVKPDESLKGQFIAQLVADGAPTATLRSKKADGYVLGRYYTVTFTPTVTAVEPYEAKAAA